MTASEVPTGALGDAEIFRAVDQTVLNVLLPALPDDAEWARAAAIQLVGLVRYAADRGPDQTAARVEAIQAELARLVAVGNTIVTDSWDGGRSQKAVMTAAGAALAASVGRHDQAAEQVRAELRPLLVGQLDDELAETAPLVNAFRGRLDG